MTKRRELIEQMIQMCEPFLPPFYDAFLVRSCLDPYRVVQVPPCFAISYEGVSCVVPPWAVECEVMACGLFVAAMAVCVFGFAYVV